MEPPRPPASPTPDGAFAPAASAPAPLPDLGADPSVLTEPRRTPDRRALHFGLFLATFVTTTLAGGNWASRTALYQQDAWFDALGMLVGPSFLADGLRFSVPLLVFLLAHEFGHYVAARRYGVDVSLPYFIPLPLPPPMLTFGTMGAVIRLREPLPTTRALFDMGAAGPLAGFVVALGLLAYALATLPPPAYLLDVGPGHELLHQHLRTYGTFPDAPLLPRTVDPGAVGSGLNGGLLYTSLAAQFARVPPPWEMYHYPTLLAAWLALVFTALNLLPVGQLDGGHVTYALFGRRGHGVIARLTVLAMLALGGLGVLPLLRAAMDAPSPVQGVLAWTAFAAFAFWVLRALASRSLAAVALLVLVVGLALAGTAGGALAGLAERYGYAGWLFWTFLLVRVIRINHPPSQVEERLGPGRTALAWGCLVLLVLLVTWKPFDL